jgi:RNAse (barnase) inhibitor barstar
MKKQIHIDTEEIVSMPSLYSFFEHELGRDFAHNLDALADVLSDEENIIVAINDITHFRSIFDPKMTKKYFKKRYTEDMSTLAEMLLEIFHPYIEQI